MFSSSNPIGWKGYSLAAGAKGFLKAAREHMNGFPKACPEPAISLHSYHVSLVQWTNPLLLVTRDLGGLKWNQDSPVSVVSLQANVKDILPRIFIYCLQWLSELGSVTSEDTPPSLSASISSRYFFSWADRASFTLIRFDMSPRPRATLILFTYRTWGTHISLFTLKWWSDLHLPPPPSHPPMQTSQSLHPFTPSSHHHFTTSRVHPFNPSLLPHINLRPSCFAKQQKVFDGHFVQGEGYFPLSKPLFTDVYNLCSGSKLLRLKILVKLGNYLWKHAESGFGPKLTSKTENLIRIRKNHFESTTRVCTPH